MGTIRVGVNPLSAGIASKADEMRSSHVRDDDPLIGTSSAGCLFVVAIVVRPSVVQLKVSSTNGKTLNLKTGAKTTDAR